MTVLTAQWILDTSSGDSDIKSSQITRLDTMHLGQICSVAVQLGVDLSKFICQRQRLFFTATSHMIQWSNLPKKRFGPHRKKCWLDTNGDIKDIKISNILLPSSRILPFTHTQSDLIWDLLYSVPLVHHLLENNTKYTIG